METAQLRETGSCIVKKKIKNTAEKLAESVTDLIKIDTKNQKKEEEKKF